MSSDSFSVGGGGGCGGGGGSSTMSLGSAGSKGGRRRAKSPVNIAALMARGGGGAAAGGGGKISSSSAGPSPTLAAPYQSARIRSSSTGSKGPEPPMAIVKMGGQDRSFARNSDQLVELPVPDYFSRVVSEMDRYASGHSMDSSTGSGGGSSDFISPFSLGKTEGGGGGSGLSYSFPDDPFGSSSGGTAAPCILDMDEDQISAEFDMQQVLAQTGAAAASPEEEDQPPTTQRKARRRRSSLASLPEEEELVNPAEARPSFIAQQEELLRQFNAAMKENKDDDTQYDMDSSTSSLPELSSQRRRGNSPQATENRRMSMHYQSAPSSTTSRRGRFANAKKRQENNNNNGVGEEEDPLASGSFHKIIVQRSHGVMTDDEIKQQEIERRNNTAATTVGPGATKARPDSPKPDPRIAQRVPTPWELAQQKAQERAGGTTKMSDEEIKRQEIERKKNSTRVAPPQVINTNSQELMMDSSLHSLMSNPSEQQAMLDHWNSFGGDDMDAIVSGLSGTQQTPSKRHSRSDRINKNSNSNGGTASMDCSDPGPGYSRRATTNVSPRRSSCGDVNSLGRSATHTGMNQRKQGLSSYPRGRSPPNRKPQKQHQQEEESDPLSSTSLRRIIVERSQGAMTDDEIKQQEIERMKNTSATVVGFQGSTNKSTRQSSPKPQPGPRRSPTPWEKAQQQARERVTNNGSKMMTDEQIKRQQIERKKNSSPVGPQASSSDEEMMMDSSLRSLPDRRPTTPPKVLAAQEAMMDHWNSFREDMDASTCSLPETARPRHSRRNRIHSNSANAAVATMDRSDPGFSRRSTTAVSPRRSGTKNAQQDPPPRRSSTDVGIPHKANPRGRFANHKKQQSQQEGEVDTLSSGSLHRIIVERSQGAMTDDEIKQQEIDRMKATSATVVGFQGGVKPARPSSPKSKPGPRRSPTPWEMAQQKAKEKVTNSGSKMMTDEQIKQQEIERKKNSTTVGPQANRDEESMMDSSLRSLPDRRPTTPPAVLAAQEAMMDHWNSYRGDMDASPCSLPDTARPRHSRRNRTNSNNTTAVMDRSDPGYSRRSTTAVSPRRGGNKNAQQDPPPRRSSTDVGIQNRQAQANPRGRFAHHKKQLSQQEGEGDIMSSGSLHRIIVERSAGAMTDDEIKQQEIERMKNTSATVVGFQGTAGNTKASPQPEPRRTRSPTPWEMAQQKAQKQATVCGSKLTDEEIKQQEIQRKNNSTSVGPQARVEGRQASPNRQQERVQQQSPSPPRQVSPSRQRQQQQRARSPMRTESNEDSFLMSKNSLRNIIVDRSNGVMTDDEIKQLEYKRMNESISSLPEQHHQARRKSPNRRSLPQPQRHLAQSAAGRGRVSAGNPKADEKDRFPGNTLALSPASSSTNDDVQDDARIKQQENDMCLNSVVAERANNAAMETSASADSDSRIKREAAAGNSVTTTTTTDSPAVAAATSASNQVDNNVEYSSSGTPMVKQRLPPGCKRPGAYSGAPGMGYNRIQSLRISGLRGSMDTSCDEGRNDAPRIRDGSSTFQMDGSESFVGDSDPSPSASDNNNNSNSNNDGDSPGNNAINNEETTNVLPEETTPTTKPAMEKKKSFRKPFGKKAFKSVFNFVGRSFKRSAKK